MRVNDVSTRRSAMTHILPVFMLGVVLLLAGSCPASAATISVTNLNESGPGSLRQAITDAMATPAADTITFNVSGTITLLSALPYITSAGGALAIDGSGRSITISGNNSSFLFLADSGASLVLENLTMINAANSALINAGSMTVISCALQGNSSSDGGAIRVANGGTLLLANSVISGNSATSRGGGISAGAGAALNISNSTIANNAASTYGGGIYIFSGATVTISDSSISGNSAALSGGGIENQGNVTITGSTVINNTSGFGGGISANNASAVLNMTNSTVSNNTASSSGGGLAAQNGTVTLQNVTVAYNSAQLPSNCGNLHLQSATVNAGNSIIANQISGLNCCKSPADTGSVISSGYNLDSENSCWFNATGDIINTDPLLGALWAYGGLTMTHALLNGSPAIDAGNGAACPAADQRGVARPQGSGCDIGAFEAVTYAIHTSLGANGSSILCSPYDSMTGGSNPIYYIVEQSDPLCAITPSIGYHVADVLVGPYGTTPVSVGPLYTYGFANIQGNKSIQASFAANSNSIWLFKGGGLPNNTTSTSINQAMTQAAADDDDEIRVHSGAYLEGFGLTCNGDFGGVIPKLSGGWLNFLATDTKPTVIAPKLTISGSCSLEFDEITVQ